MGRRFRLKKHRLAEGWGDRATELFGSDAILDENPLADVIPPIENLGNSAARGWKILHLSVGRQLSPEQAFDLALASH